MVHLIQYIFLKRGKKLKKNSGKIIGIAIAVLAVAICICAFVVVRVRSNSNPTRRDESLISAHGKGDEGLDEVDGSLNGQESPGAASASTASTADMLVESVIQNNANSPLSENVETVRKIGIPEAVIIGDGDIGSFYSDEEFKDVVPVDIDSFAQEDIPVKYDSRDVDGKCYVTPVKDQGYSYLCWTFAAMGACESDILKHHSDIGSGDINLSEKHLAYYNMHSAPGSVSGLIDEDYREFVNDVGEANAFVVENDTGYLTCGGVTDFVISLLTAWKGPVNDTASDSFKSLYGSYYLLNDNTDKPSDAYSDSYHVQNVMQIPSVNTNFNLIKQMVMEHGAATIGVCADSEYFKNHSGTLYSTFKGEKAATADHEVLIIGWDDEYSASNFKYTPPGDGAWICKNSWGTNVGEQGCFYLSYYDETVAVSNAASYDVALPGEDEWYDNNYQAAGFITDVVSTLDDAENTTNALSASSNPYGMLYEIQGKERLEAVGLMSLELYQQYDISVYLNPEVEGDEISFAGAEPVREMKVSNISGGYHTYPLDESLDVEKGDMIFILVKPHTKGRVVIEDAKEMISDPNYDEWNNLTGNIHNNYTASGCSFYISDDGSAMVRQNDKDFFVKAYTVNK